jgi:hypothetical protein
MQAPLMSDSLATYPIVRCVACGGTNFGDPDLAMQWAAPCVAHLSAVCDHCHTVNHLRLGFHRGRIELSQRRTNNA